MALGPPLTDTHRGPLPSPRQMLTSLITSIASIPDPWDSADDSDSDSDSDGGAARANDDVSGQPGQAARRDSRPASPSEPPEASVPRIKSDVAGKGKKRTKKPRQRPAANPLSRIHPVHRPLFTALHALYPALLLPALDLLDRGLVSRLELEREGASTTAAAPPVMAAKGVVYHVRSAQKQHVIDEGGGGGGRGRSSRANNHHSHDGGPTGGLTYVVHLRAWNCSCAAFAFSAFPAGDRGGSLFAGGPRGEGGKGDQPRDPGRDRLPRMEEGEEPSLPVPDKSWQFGGLSLDGVPGSAAWCGGQGVPCCKHLLACLLADRWAALGRYVDAKTVGRAELAGIVAQI